MSLNFDWVGQCLLSANVASEPVSEPVDKVYNPHLFKVQPMRYSIPSEDMKSPILYNDNDNKRASKPARGYHKEHHRGRRGIITAYLTGRKGKIKQAYSGMKQWVPAVIDVSIIVVLHPNRWLRVDRLFR